MGQEKGRDQRIHGKTMPSLCKLFHRISKVRRRMVSIIFVGLHHVRKVRADRGMDKIKINVAVLIRLTHHRRNGVHGVKQEPRITLELRNRSRFTFACSSSTNTKDLSGQRCLTHSFTRILPSLRHLNFCVNATTSAVYSGTLGHVVLCRAGAS
jgi:hypothetical protein